MTSLAFKSCSVKAAAVLYSNGLVTAAAITKRK
jgi:hypothetical protein